VAAYVTGTAVGPGAGDAFFQVLRTVMDANGWSEYDVISDSVGNRDIVFRGTAGDTTANNRPYIRVAMVSNAYSHRVYTDWDATTHVGTHQCGTGTGGATQDATFTYWIRVNEFAIAHCVKLGAVYYKSYAGFVRRAMPPAREGLTKTSSGYAAGTTTMNVDSDMTLKLKVGQKVVIYNHSNNSAGANFHNSEMLVVQSVASGSITFEYGSNFAYDAGAVIGWNPSPVVNFYINNNEVIIGSCLANMGHNGVYGGTTVHTCSVDPYIFASEVNSDPSDISLEYAPGVYIATLSSSTWGTGYHGYLYHYESAASSAQVKEDTMTDGINTYVVLGVSTTSVMLLGPT
jgi:hypothetical protein